MLNALSLFAGIVGSYNHRRMHALIAGEAAVPVERIHTFLVQPGRGAEARQINGANVPLDGNLFNLLNDVYAKSDVECDSEISFNQGADGRQENPCRNLIIDYLSTPNVPRGRKLAQRLESVTTHRSGLGLLFLISGMEGLSYKIVISRFPADSAILAEENQEDLTVEFLERVFMKSATAYKASTYRDASLEAGFWHGRAVDKQINSGLMQLSNYWIFEFLDSDFRTTAAAGTRRLARALRNAAKKTELIGVKSEIAAAVTLAGGVGRRRLSIREFSEQMGLSEPARNAIEEEVGSDRLLNERFQFDLNEFKEQVPYRTVQLNSGGILTAESGNFDEVFQREVVNEQDKLVRYSTVGKVVTEKLSKRP